MKKSTVLFFVMMLSLFMYPSLATPSEPEIKALPRIYYITFLSLDSAKPLTVAAQFRLPWRKGGMPAVVIIL